ncbi:hypothetical protein G6F56_000977 [Rhizopus delemar]|nr:hypothetical protein G6F56_000977 [Rhizopus delemar]
MSRFYATAFRSINTSLTKQTRIATLGLYRSLLRSSKKYESHESMKKIIQQKFRTHRYITSRPKVLELLSEGNQIDWHLKKDDEQTKQRVSQYFKEEVRVKKPWVQQKKKKKYIKRKPHQVALVVTHSTGYQFRRVRGWTQPVKVSMIIKKFTKKIQKRLDRYAELLEHLEMVKKENQFERDLGIRGHDVWLQCEQHIRDALEYNHRKNLKTKTIEEPEK